MLSCFTVVLKSLALSLILLPLIPTAALAQNSPRRECEPLGRIFSRYDGRTHAGSVICNGDRVPTLVKGKVSLFCFALGRFADLTGTNPLFSNCKPSPTLFGPHSAGGRYYRRTRGPEEAVNGLTLLTPYGNTLLSGRPDFSWSPVAGATHYALQVQSLRGTGWHSQVQSIAVSYPPDQPVLSAGSVYRVSVLAYRDKALVGTSTKQVNILPAAAAQELSKIVQQLNGSGLAEDEKAFLDLNAAYTSRGLVDEAIRALQARVEAGSRNPRVFRALGNRFLSAGLPQYAMAQYETAKTLAKASNNSVELTKAQAGLRLAALLQQELESGNP